jgi:DNA-binding CsgD family transcriptional regulator/tetratricopeptide (TPR) repeat protein
MELVERGGYLVALGEHLDAAAAGEGRLVLVGGEAGVGKTTLVHRFAHDHADDARILWAACDGLFTPQPLAPLTDLGLSYEAPRQEVFAAVLETLTREPTLAVLEDVHWADEATLDLLRYLGRRLDRTSTLLVATYRDDEIGPNHPLRVVLGEVGDARRVALRPLSVEGVRTLAAGSEQDPVELHRLTSGNPFFVTEALAGGGAGVPASIRDAVLARVWGLSPEARKVLEAAAVAGPDLSVLESVLGGKPRALEECLAAGVLRVDDDGVVFRHELARQVVQDSVEPVRRIELHTRTLVALGDDADSARLAHHAEAAGDEAAVLEHAQRAAERASQLGAHREAAEQYARALRFSDGLPPDSVAALLERRAYECYVTERIEDALAAQHKALELYRTLGNKLKEGDVLRVMSRFVYLGARIDDARETAREAVAVLEQLQPGAELGRAYGNMAHLAQIDLDFESALSWGERAIALGVEFGDQDLVIDTMISVGIAEAIAGRGTSRLEQGLDLALDEGTDDAVARAYGALAFVATRRRDWPAADRWLDTGIRQTTDRDLDSRRLYLLGWRAAAAIHRGRWDAAAADAMEVLRHPHARLNRVWALLALAGVRARIGDPGVWDLLEEAAELTRGEASQKLAPMAIARAEAAYLGGDSGRAQAETGTMPVATLLDRWIAGSLAVWRRRTGAKAEETGTIPEPFALELEGDFRAAAEWLEEHGCSYDAAMTLVQSWNEADLRRSHETFAELGARPAAAIAAQKLRELGVRGLARGPRAATRGNPRGLTTRELEVLERLGEGLTNAEIAARLVISEKTVGHHVSAILGKLGVRSRYDAAKLASKDRELAEPR